MSFGTWGFKSPFAHICDESRHGLHLSRVIGDRLPRPSAGVFLLVAPVVAVGVDVVAADEVVAGFADDGDNLGGYEYQDRGVGVFAADAEVVQAAAVAQGELAELVDGVVADAEVFGGAGGVGLGQGVVDGVWCGAGAVGAVGWFGVVDRGEGVEQLL